MRWRPNIRTVAGKFFWGLAVTGGLAVLATAGRIAWVAIGLNVESLMQTEGWDQALVKVWPSVVRWMAGNDVWLLLGTSALLGGIICTAIYRYLVRFDRPPKSERE